MPSPAPGPTPSDEQALDDILDNVDRLTNHICKKATERNNGKLDTPPPTQAFSPARYKKTKAAFQQLSESKIMLSDSNHTLPAAAEEEKAERPKPKPRPKSIWPWRKTVTG